MSNRTPLKLPRVLPHLVYYEAPAADQFPADIPFPRQQRWAGQERSGHPEKQERSGPEKRARELERAAGVVLLLILLCAGVFFILQDVAALIDNRPRWVVPSTLQIVPPPSDFFIPSPAPPKTRPHPSKFRANLEGDLISANFMAFSEFEREEEKKRGIEV